MNGDMSAREVPCKWGISESRVHKLCQQVCIPGLERLGRSLGRPADANNPEDPRYISTAALRGNEDKLQ